MDFRRHQRLLPPYRPSLGIPKRDRSKSLVVDRVAPLITLDKTFLEPCQPRRRSTSSSSTELVNRRGFFSRRPYGSVELLAHCENEGSELSSRRFRVECGERADKDDMYSSPSTPVLENPEYQTRWYFNASKLRRDGFGTGTILILNLGQRHKQPMRTSVPCHTLEKNRYAKDLFALLTAQAFDTEIEIS
uniref:Uncharacterized protein n=1 Tax=Strigamia maritima TaxID=126957 RepID=T1JL98_STRMM